MSDFHFEAPYLTKKQREALSAIEALTEPRGPTLRRLAKVLGLSARGAHERVLALARKGCVELASQSNRGTRITKKGLGVLGLDNLKGGLHG